MKSEKVFIYIESSKPFYYSGEQISASVYLDVLSNIQTSKMIIIAKGKEIIKILYLKIEIKNENIVDLHVIMRTKMNQKIQLQLQEKLMKKILYLNSKK